MGRRGRHAVTPQRRPGPEDAPGILTLPLPIAPKIGLTEILHGCSVPHRFDLLQWALRAGLSILQYVGIPLCGAEVLVTEKFLYRSNVSALLQQVRCKPTAGRFTERSGVNEWRSV